MKTSNDHNGLRDRKRSGRRLSARKRSTSRRPHDAGDRGGRLSDEDAFAYLENEHPQRGDDPDEMGIVPMPHSIEPRGSTAIDEERFRLPESQAELDTMFEDIGSIRESFKRRLMKAAMGQQRITLDDVTDVLAKHLLELDGQASSMAATSDLILDMIFGPRNERGVSSGTSLVVLEKLTRIHSRRLSDIRRTSELLARLMTPARVDVTIRPRRRVQQFV
jgi:hypothetical protein